jgi:filamentous hemagglutinin family protein
MKKPGARATGAFQGKLSSRPRPEPASSIRVAVKAALTAASSAAALLAVNPALAGPQQGTVAAGKASISTAVPGHTQIDQSTSKAIINWGSFSIASGESVTFSQPSSDSATLNRVIGSSKSFIDGALSANGQVLILNSAGVLFGHNAQVNVGSLIATTSNIADPDFLNGKLSFHAPGTAVGEVANEGSIRVADQGLAALVAPTVRNSGVIQARLGRIALASGETFTVDLYGDHLINFAVGQAAGANSTRSLEQRGTLIADGGKVVISSDAAAGVVGNVVNLSGVIQARTVSRSQTGEIVLEAPQSDVNVSGTLDASGTTGLPGGTIDLDAANLQTAAESQIDASALDQGDGGHIKLWGTNGLAVAGDVSARAGAHSGRGGDLDLSTAGGLSVTGNIDLQAPHGAAGSLLLDPASITVAESGSSDPTASVVGAPFLNRELQSGTNVTLSATDSITVDAAIDGRVAGTSAASHPSGSVSLTAGSLTIAAPIVTDRAPITLTATGTASGSGNISFTGSNLTASQPNSGFLWVADCSGSCSSRTIGSAAITLSAGGNVSSDATAPSNGQLATLGAVTIDTRGNVSGLPALNGIATSGGAASGIGSLTIDAGGTASLNGAKSNGAIQVSAAAITTGGSPLYASTGGVTLSAGSGGITINPAQDAGGNASGVHGGDVQLVTTGTVTVNSDVTASGKLCIAGASATCSGSASTAAGNIDAHNATLQAGSATGTQGITLVSADSISASTLLLGSQGTASLIAANAVTVLDPIAGYTGTGSIGSLAITAGGDVALNGANVGISSSNAPAVGGATVQITSGGNITLTGAPLISRDGISISLTGAGSGLMVNTSPSSDAGLVAGFGVTTGNTVDLTHVLDSTASITITRDANLATFNGPVVLKEGLLAAGSINVGTSSARVAAVCGDAACTADAATLQAGPDKTGTSSIGIFANGQVSASKLLVGESGSVTLDSAGSVSISQPLSGFAGSLGIGSLTATSGQDLSLAGGTIGDSPSVTAGEGIATLTAANQFTTGRNSLIARDGISITAGSTVTLNPVSGGGAALVAGYDASGAYDVIAGHIPTVQINDATNAASLKIDTDGGILSAGDILIGSQSRVGQVTSLTTPGTLQAGDPTHNVGATVSIAANGSVELGPVLVGPQGWININPNDTSTSTSGSVTFDKGLYGFSSAGTQLGIGSLIVDSDGTIAIPGVLANQDITLTGYTPSATVHGGFISTPGDVSLANGQGPWSAGGAIQVTLDGGDVTFALPVAPNTVSLSAGSTIDIFHAGAVTIPGTVDAPGGVDIGFASTVPADIVSSISVGAINSGGDNYLNATGSVDVGPWLGTAGAYINISGSDVATAGITNGPLDNGLLPGVTNIGIRGTQSVTVNGPLAVTQNNSAGPFNLSVQTATGGTINLKSSIELFGTGTIFIGADDPNALTGAYDASIGANAAQVTINMFAPVIQTGGSGTGMVIFDGNVKLFPGMTDDRWLLGIPGTTGAWQVGNLSGVDSLGNGIRNYTTITDVLQALDAAGNPLANPLPRSTAAPAGCAYYVCPGDPLPSTNYATPLPAGVVGNDAVGWTNAFATLALNVQGDKVVFNGSITRSVPSNLPATAAFPSQPLEANTGTCQSNFNCDIYLLSMYSTFVPVTLNVLGNTSVTFNGPVGDSLATAAAAMGQSLAAGGTALDTPPTQCLNGSLCTPVIPALGPFWVSAGGAPAGGNKSNVACVNACASSTTYLEYSGASGGGPSSWVTAGGTTEFDFIYQLSDTNPGNNDLGLNSVGNLTQNAAGVVSVSAFGAFAGNPLQPNAAPGSTASGAVAGAGANGAGAAVLGGADFSVSSTTAEAVAAVDGVTTADARRQQQGAEDEEAANATTDTCPRGAGSTADLGTRPGVSGASPNVFSRCGHTEVSYRASTQ